MLTGDEMNALSNLNVSPDNLRELYMRGDLSELKEKVESAEINSEGLAQIRDDLEARGRAEIDQISVELKNRLQQEREKAEAKLKSVSDDIREDGEDIGIGYAASTVSLITMAIFAPQVIMACRLKPSAVVYGGTAAVYLVRELKNSMKFRSKALSEIEYVEVNLDSSKGLRQNVDTAKKALNLQFELINRYKGFVEQAVDSIDEKAKSAKMASYGFLAASAVAAAETFAFDAGACTEGAIKTFVPKRDQLPGLLEAIDRAPTPVQAYIEFLNYEKTARGEFVSITLEEYQDLVRAFSSVEFDFKEVFKTAAIQFSNVFIPVAVSQEIQVKKYELSPDLKRKEAKYLMDTDKVFALLLGGSSLVASSFLPGYQAMLKKIVSSGAMRAVVFGANGGVAMMASKHFEESAASLKKKLDDLQQLLDRGQELGNQGFEFIDSVLDSEEAERLAGHLGLDRDLADHSVKDIEESLKQKADDEIMDQLPRDVEVNEELLKNFTSHSMRLKDWVTALLMSSAQARETPSKAAFRLRCYDAGSCPPPPFPQMNHSSFSRLNTVLRDYQSYAAQTYSAQEIDHTVIEKKIEAHDQVLNQYRSQLYKAINQQMVQKNQRPISFLELEKKEQQEILNLINKSFSGKTARLSSPPTLANKPAPTVEAQDRVAKAKKREKSPGLSAMDYNILMGLIERLEHSMQTTGSAYAQESQHYWPLHAKDVSIFDAIHHRHRQVFSTFYLEAQE